MAKTVHSKVVLSAKDDVSPTLGNLQKKFKSFSRAAQSVGSKLKSLSAITFAPIAGGLASAVAAAKSAIFAFADYGSSVDDTARSLSIASDSLQAFRYAASLGGSSAGEMDSAIAMLNKNMANMAAGSNKNLAKLMDDLGISMKDANGRMKTAAELIPEIADSIKSQSNATQKAYIATQFFGRSGQNLIKTLSDGSDGLIQAREEAEKYGVVLGKDDVAYTALFSDSLTRTRYAVQGVQFAIGRQLLPVMQPMLDGMNDWIANNREWIASAITEAIIDFSKSLEKIDFKAVITGAVNFTKSCVNLFTAMGGLKTVAIAIGALFVGKVAIGIVSTVSAFSTMIKVLWPLTKAVWAFNSAMLANPVTWIVLGIVAAVAALGGAIYYIYNNWDSLVAWFTDLWEQIKDVFSSFWEWYKDYWPGVANIAISLFDGFVTFFTDTIPDSIKKAWEGLKTWFLDLIESMLGPAKGIIDTISSVTGTVTSGVSKAWDSVTGFFGGSDNSDQVQRAVASPLRGALPTLVGESRFNGAMEIRLHTDPGTTAEVTEQRSDNYAMRMNVKQDTGRSR